MPINFDQWLALHNLARHGEQPDPTHAKILLKMRLIKSSKTVGTYVTAAGFKVLDSDSIIQTIAGKAYG